MRERLAPLLEAANNGSMSANGGKAGGSTGTLAQPRLLSDELRMLPHQLVGLSWLRGLQQGGSRGRQWLVRAVSLAHRRGDHTLGIVLRFARVSDGPAQCKHLADPRDVKRSLRPAKRHSQPQFARSQPDVRLPTLCTQPLSAAPDPRLPSMGRVAYSLTIWAWARRSRPSRSSLKRLTR
eukprot:scaffold26437_cov120-Isochrysis_galbana.AAC.5